MGHPNKEEPTNIAKAIKELNLKYAVLTSVDRDDLNDGGAGHFAQTISEIYKINNNITVEALIPDFSLKISSLEKVAHSNAPVIGHNLETVERLTPFLRDKKANYKNSLELLSIIKKINSKITIKSAFQLGFGETDKEIHKTLTDLKENNVDIIVIGQYLRPTNHQIAVQEYIHPDKFQDYKEYAEKLGFLHVISAPLARSSYKASSAFY